MVYKTLPRSIYQRMPKELPRSLGFERYTLSFDGVDDCVRVLHDPSISLPDDFTVGIWIKTTFVPSTWTAVINKPYAGTPVNYRIYLDASGYARGEIHDGTVSVNANSLTNVSDGVWHNIVLLRSTAEDKVKIYVDGELKAQVTDPTTASIESPYDLYISRGGLWYSGLTALALIYNRALSDEEIRWNRLNYHNPVRDGLVLWLPMEEGVGTTVRDLSGYENHGTIYGAVWERVMQWEIRAETE